jgi:hypothetical protein
MQEALIVILMLIGQAQTFVISRSFPDCNFSNPLPIPRDFLGGYRAHILGKSLNLKDRPIILSKHNVMGVGDAGNIERITMMDVADFPRNLAMAGIHKIGRWLKIQSIRNMLFTKMEAKCACF